MFGKSIVRIEMNVRAKKIGTQKIGNGVHAGIIEKIGTRMQKTGRGKQSSQVVPNGNTVHGRIMKAEERIRQQVPAMISHLETVSTKAPSP